MGGGNSHQRKIAKKAEERIAEKAAHKVVQQIEARSATSVTSSSGTSELPHSFREKLGSFWGSTPIWAAIAVLIGAIVSQISLKLLFIGVWAVVFMEFVRVGVFVNRAAKVIGNIATALVLALAFFQLWKVIPKPTTPPTVDQYVTAIASRFPWLSNPPLSQTVVVQKDRGDPVLHLEPEMAELWSEKPPEVLGVFHLSLHNTGPEDVDITDVSEDYFVAEQKNGMTIKRVGGTPIVNKIGPALKAGAKAPIRVDFREKSAIMNEIAQNAGAPYCMGVKIKVLFRRHADGKDFSLIRGFGMIGAGNAMYTAGTSMDSLRVQGVNITISQVLPYLEKPDNWTVGIHAVGTDQNGQPINKWY